MPQRGFLTDFVNAAASQRDRWLPALHPDYAKADGRSIPDLLAFAARLAPVINYYGPDDRLHGDWSDFFAHDPILVLASIATTDLEAMEQKVATGVRRLRAERTEQRKRELLDELFDSALELSQQVDRWRRALEPRGTGTGTAFGGARIVLDIHDELRRLVHLLRSSDAGGARSQARGGSAFRIDWSLEAPTDDESPAAERVSESVDDALTHLLRAWQPIADTVARWAAAAPSQLAAALDAADGRHSPHVALFVAFAHLLGVAQESMNDFAARRADFYFRRVLRDRNRESVADAAYIAFALGSGTPAAVTIPRGTRLLGGKDAEGRDQVFVACDDLTVGGAALAEVRTVRAVTGLLLPHETARVVERVVSRELTCEEANAGGFAAFGREADEAASLGFAVGSPALWLKGGTRAVTLTFDCAPLSPAATELLTRLNLATGLDDDRILERLLLGAFVLSVSSSTGWMPVCEYAIELAPGRSGGGFSLRFTVDAMAPPVAPFGGSLLTADSPAVRVMLRQERVALDDGGATAVYPLSVLSALSVTGVHVRVVVEQLEPEVVENSGGIVDRTKPFPAFGAVPVVGSYLTIRERELSVKDLDLLTLRVTWFGLPADETGFEGYYRGYVISPNGLPHPGLFDNQAFRVAIGESEHYLFRTANTGPVPEPGGRLAKDTVFREVAIPAGGATNRNPGRDSLRVELAAPPYAFGNGIYAQNVVHAAMTPLTASGCEASCQAEYAFLLHAARNVESVLPPLTETGWRGRMIEAARAFQGLRTRAGTVWSNTTATLGSLADAAAESLAAALEERREIAPPAAHAGWGERLAACRRGPALERLAACEALRTTIRGAVAATPGVPESSHLNRCELILDVAQWVRDSDDGYSDASGWLYRRGIRGNLTKCIAELRARYDAAVKACTAECTQQKLQFRPNAPNLPQIESLSFDYSASGEATLFAHLLPFGGERRLEMEADAGVGLLPRFAHEGNLYIGCSRLEGPATLPLYVRIGQTRDPGPTSVWWSYLAGNQWLALPSPRPGDDPISNLRTSGTVTLTVPERDERQTSSILPDGFRWIRAAVANVGDGPQVLGIYPHAVKATRVPERGAVGSDHPLPARTITALAKPVRGIAVVTQPAASFGGRAAESDRDFQVRVSERLRHKARAIVGWDYERIVLERFPTVWKVRTLPATPSRDREHDLGPGIVRVVVVAGPNSADLPDPSAPMSSPEALDAMSRVLQQAAGPLVRVHVLNPVFVRVKVAATVRWRAGADPRASADRLMAAIKAYLSPWDNDVRGVRGISEPEIADFVRSWGDVELVSALSIDYDPAGPLVSEPDRCCLTTAAAHEIHSEVLAGAEVRHGY